MRVNQRYILLLCLLIGLFGGMGVCPVMAQQQLYPARTEAYPEVVHPDYYKHHFYKGHQFVPQLLPVNGSPNHGEWDILDRSTVVYDGLRYSPVPLMYNLAEDQLITRHPDTEDYIILESHMVRAFELDGDEFVYIGPEHPPLDVGFYQVIYQSEDFVCYARRQKTMQLHNSGSHIERRYQTSVEFYLDDLSNEEGFVEIRRHRDVLRVDRSQRSAVRRTLRAADLHFKRQPEQTLITVLRMIQDSR